MPPLPTIHRYMFPPSLKISLRGSLNSANLECGGGSETLQEGGRGRWHGQDGVARLMAWAAGAGVRVCWYRFSSVQSLSRVRAGTLTLKRNGGIKRPRFVAFADFHGVNIPTMADFKLLK